MPTTGARAAIQGFGNAGSVVAKLLARDGWKIVAVTDSRAGVYNPKGLAVNALLEYKLRTRSVSGYPDADSLDNRKILQLDSQPLLPAPLEDHITLENP